MPSNRLVLCRPLLLLPSIFPSIRVFSNESTLRIRWPKYWSLSFSISPSNEYSRLISFRMDWLALLAGNCGPMKTNVKNPLCTWWTTELKREQQGAQKPNPPRQDQKQQLFQTLDTELELYSPPANECRGRSHHITSAWMKNGGLAKQTHHHEKEMKVKKMTVLSTRQQYSRQSGRWHWGRTEGSRLEAASSPWDGMIGAASLALSSVFVTSCLMPTLRPLVTTKCTTMCDPVHDLTYKIHGAIGPLLDRLSRKEFSLKLQFSLIRNIWG